ncbi:Molybdopterin converting factor, small subunit [Agrococcus baldri]|uniref:Molybdopterin synthase sulfur carrier subunit n=1 Tax=Agrococcus baldri TaxID=153730 RepID=A0AA94HL76_9MICO|nr:MoaD/ThiS family protein [Agrococcus baldri]SFS03700.1 Molybdopterin converting factor, small subunit [Agrococcus baldri]
MTRVRYFAAALEATGLDEERRGEQTVGALRAGLVADHPGLAGILSQCAVLVDGSRVDDAASLADAELVDVLPPFAGG